MSVTDPTFSAVAHVDRTSADGKAWSISGHDKRTPQHVFRLEFALDPLTADQVLIKRLVAEGRELTIKSRRHECNARRLGPRNFLEQITMNQIIIWFWRHVAPAAQAEPEQAEGADDGAEVSP